MVGVNSTLFLLTKEEICSKPFFVPSISSINSLLLGIIPNAVSLKDVAPCGFVLCFGINYLKIALTILLVTGSPSSFVVLNIISGITARNKLNKLVLVVFFFLYLV
jgi:hypothetical protein